MQNAKPPVLSAQTLRKQLRGLQIVEAPPALNEPGKRLYIASDLHLGAPDAQSSLEREKRFVRWLDSIKADAGAIILLGDVFDFWFEYKTVIPRGFTRLLGKLAELSDAGITITAFVGNHDLWLRDYFPCELGIRVAHAPERQVYFGKIFFLAHGDGLGPGDAEFKFFRRLFTSPFFNWLFGLVHPDIAVSVAHYFSRRSAKKTRGHDQSDYGEREFLYQFVRALEAHGQGADYYVFGHRHHIKRQAMAEGELIVIGDWLSANSYLEVSAAGVELKQFAG
jgi:UDP-2,3-diacylglucosamine hydrolase